MAAKKQEDIQMNHSYTTDIMGLLYQIVKCILVSNLHWNGFGFAARMQKCGFSLQKKQNWRFFLLNRQNTDSIENRVDGLINRYPLSASGYLAELTKKCFSFEIRSTDRLRYYLLVFASHCIINARTNCDSSVCPN